MVTPRVRRSVSAPSGDLPDNSKPVELVVDEGTVADVIEEQGNKRFSYQAKVKQSEEIENESYDNDNDPDDLPSNTQDQIQELPKTPLDRLFDDIAQAISEGAYDSFYAKLVRIPDAMSDRFNVPCRDLIELGFIQFCSLDRFSFSTAVQEYNNNSGGRFSIAIYDQNQKPLEVWNQRSISMRPVGMIMLIQNPVKKIEPQLQANSGMSELGKILEAMHSANIENNRRLLEAITAKPQKTTLEDAIERKVLSDILNPPQNNGSSTFEQTMASIMAMPAMVEGLGRKMFPPDPPPPAEPDMIDKATRIANLPVVQTLVERITDIADGIAAAKFGDQATQNGVAPQNVEYSNPDNVVELPPNEMNELTTTIITELAGNNPLNADNAVIQNLSDTYADQFDELAETCKALPFENILGLLLKRLAKQDAAMFSNYIDVAQTQATNAYVWTPEGEHLKNRLNELYEYLKTLPD